MEVVRIVELRQGNALLRLAPSLGGRATRCALENGSGAPIDLFEPYPEGHRDLDRWAKGGLYPLIPYGGRIAGARLHDGALVHSLEPHPDARPHTLHGTAHRRAWTLANHTADAATLRLAHAPDAHWPWHYSAEMRFTLQARRLHVAISLTNTDGRPMPAGMGLHPYLRRPFAMRLQFSARNGWPATADYLASRPAAIGACDDFGQPRALGDAGRTLFYGGWNGVARIMGAAGEGVVLCASASLDHLVLHQPEAATYLCLEPMSHVADAFNLAGRGIDDTGARTLAPGASLDGWVSFSSTDPSKEQHVYEPHPRALA